MPSDSRQIYEGNLANGSLKGILTILSSENIYDKISLENKIRDDAFDYSGGYTLDNEFLTVLNVDFSKYVYTDLDDATGKITYQEDTLTIDESAQRTIIEITANKKTKEINNVVINIYSVAGDKIKDSSNLDIMQNTVLSYDSIGNWFSKLDKLDTGNEIIKELSGVIDVVDQGVPSWVITSITLN